MARKRRGQAEAESLVDEKVKKLEGMLEFLHEQEKEYEAYLNATSKNITDKIYKMYDDHLKAIPEYIRNMTIQELIDLQQQEAESDNGADIESIKQVKSNLERHKIMSEKKKTQRMSRLERKRSLSACSSIKSKPGNPTSRLSRVLSESNLYTPLSKRSVAPAFVVTPKFNPKSVVNKNLMRKPRAGEVIMSLSGSPLQNILNDIADKPGLTVSFGGGKMISIEVDKEIEKAHIALDEETKKRLELAKNKLEEMLKSE